MIRLIPLFNNFQALLRRVVIPGAISSVFCVSYILLNLSNNLFSVLGLIVCVSCFLLALIIFAYSKSSVQVIWGFFNVAVCIWAYGCFSIGLCGADYQCAHINWKIFVFGITFIPVFCYHFTVEYTEKHPRKFLLFSYGQAIVFTLINAGTSFLVNDLKYVYGSFYYLQANYIYTFYFLIWAIIVLASFMHLFRYYRGSSGLKRAQSTYIFYGMLIGFLGGGTTAPLAWGIQIYPAGLFLTCIYAAISTYAIFKYKFIEISIAVTRITVFLAVYLMVMGIPFAIGFGLQQELQMLFSEEWWIIPLVSSTVLATVGPYIYIFLQRKAEDKLLQEQRQYQATLRQASLGMGQIKDLKRLLNLIVHVVTRAVKIENCKIFLRHEDSKQYILKAVKGDKREDEEINKLSYDSPLVHYFNQMKEPLVYEEVKQRRFDIGGEGLKELEDILHDIDSALVVPSFIEQKLIAIISLGKKRSGKLYTYDDLAVFAILANQSALAIENAQFYEDMKRTHVQLLKAEKMATVGTMADGLSHQINNRLHAMGFIAGDLLDTVRLGLKNGVSKKQKDLLTEIESGLERIQANVKHGGEIVGGLLRYTRKGEQGYTAVNFQEMLKSAFEMAQFKIKINMMDVHKHFDDDLPQIKGNFTQLQEVFFNLIDNSYDAMMQRREDLREEGFRPRLDIFARESGPTIEIILQDNGIGVKESDMHKLFTPFFTTKATSKKGTGLGLYVIRQIIEDNHGGKVNFSSKYKIGSETQIILPVAVGKLG
ncbi:MAG: GAF domain-containing protein [Candidatus Omnitrophica bacterium]|nr:GAF domain-containing protein [Candidatus Omnitrophota bacterium]